MKKWNELPKVMQNDKVKYYYDILQEHEKELKLKRAFDIICSLIMIIILSPVAAHTWRVRRASQIASRVNDGARTPIRPSP